MTTDLRKTAPIATWLYLVVTIIIELYLATTYIGTTYGDASIGVLAASQVFAVALVYLRLKYETRSIVGVALASLFFAVLAVVLFLASLGH